MLDGKWNTCMRGSWGGVRGGRWGVDGRVVGCSLCTFCDYIARLTASIEPLMTPPHSRMNYPTHSKLKIQCKYYHISQGVTNGVNLNWFLFPCCQLCKCRHFNYGVLSTDKQNSIDLIQCAIIQYCYMFRLFTSFIIRSQKEKKKRKCLT